MQEDEEVEYEVEAIVGHLCINADIDIIDMHNHMVLHHIPAFATLLMLTNMRHDSLDNCGLRPDKCTSTHMYDNALAMPYDKDRHHRELYNMNC